MKVGTVERYKRKLVIADQAKMTVDDAMKASFSSLWQPLDDFKKTWFTKLLKKLSLADQQNFIYTDKFYQKKYWIEKVAREIGAMPPNQFIDPQNYPATLNQPYFKPDLQF